MFSCIVPIWHVPHSIFHVSCFLASFHMHHVPCIVPFNYVSCVVLHVTYSLHYMTCVMFPCIVPHHYMSSQYVPWHMFPALSLCTMLTCCSSILCSIALFHYTLSHALFLSTMFPCSLFLCIPPLVTCSCFVPVYYAPLHCFWLYYSTLLLCIVHCIMFPMHHIPWAMFHYTMFRYIMFSYIMFSSIAYIVSRLLMLCSLALFTFAFYLLARCSLALFPCTMIR